MRRFLLHVLPDGFHRIRHYGLFANGHRTKKIALCRKLLDVPSAQPESESEHDGKTAPADNPHGCPCCGGRMITIETFNRPDTGRTNPRNSIAHDRTNARLALAPQSHVSPLERPQLNATCMSFPANGRGLMPTAPSTNSRLARWTSRTLSVPPPPRPRGRGSRSLHLQRTIPIA